MKRYKKPFAKLVVIDKTVVLAGSPNATADPTSETTDNDSKRGIFDYVD